MQVIISEVWQYLLKGIAGILSVECFLLAIMVIFFACGWNWIGANKTRAHYSKAIFCWLIIAVIITAALAIISTY